MSERNIPVSVIVLTYNHKTYIRQALDSVLMQDVDFEYEILVGDDASNDGTPEILREYQSRYPDQVRLFLWEENIGPTRNAYELLRKANGKYLAFCEGDDFWLTKDKLKTQVDFLERNPEFIGCSTRCLLVGEQGERLKKQKLSWVKYKEVFTLRDFSGGRYLPGQTASIVKRNIFAQGDREYPILYEASRYLSDRTSAAVYLTQGNFACLPGCMSAYRKVTRAGAANLTSRIYKDGENKCRVELELTRRIEEYVSEAVGKAVRFGLKRCDILTDAVVEFLRKPDGVRREMLREVTKQSPWYGWLYIPCALLKKVIYR